MQRIDILTLFPEAFSGYLQHSIVGRAVEKRVVDVRLHNIRDFTRDSHHTVDDYPYGGGAGMVMKPEPIFEAVESLKKEISGDNYPVILLTPQGRLLNQKVAQALAVEPNIVLICGHYEGVDERVSKYLVNDEISIGDYLLSGGESAAIVMVDCLVRLMPGSIGSNASLTEESHVENLLEYPQYTRPPEYRGWKVPDVLLSGNHKEVARWRREQSVLRTAQRRPDLLEKAVLTDADYRTIKAAGIINN